MKHPEESNLPIVYRRRRNCASCMQMSTLFTFRLGWLDWVRLGRWEELMELKLNFEFPIEDLDDFGGTWMTWVGLG